MAKIFTILVIASILESIGVAFLAGGLKQIEGIKSISVSEIVRVVVAGAANHRIVLGIALEACFFFALLYMISQRDVSFVWPLTSLGMIITPIACRIFLHEQVSSLRWTGIGLIALGAFCISYSEKQKENRPVAAVTDSTPLGPK